MRGHVEDPHKVAVELLQGGLCLVGEDDRVVQALTGIHTDMAACLMDRSANAGLLGDRWTLGQHELVSDVFGYGDDIPTLGVLFGTKRRHNADCEHCPGGAVPIIGAVVGKIETKAGFVATMTLAVDWRPPGDPPERWSLVHIGLASVTTEVVITATPITAFLEPGDTSEAQMITWPRSQALPYGVGGLALRTTGLVNHMRGSLILAGARAGVFA